LVPIVLFFALLAAKNVTRLLVRGGAQ